MMTSQSERSSAVLALLADPGAKVFGAGDAKQAMEAGVRLASFVEKNAPQLANCPACRELVADITPFRADPARQSEAIKQLRDTPAKDLPGIRLATKAALSLAERPIDKLELKTGLDLVQHAMRHHGLEVPTPAAARQAAPARNRSGQEM